MIERQTLHKSIIDAASPQRLAALVHQCMDHIAELQKDVDRNLWLLAELCCHLDIAVCDHCGNDWFTCQPVQGIGPRGDVRGLLAAGGATCTGCLDTLYKKSIEFDQETLDELYEDVSKWMLRCRPNARWSSFGQDETIQALMKQYSI